MGINLDKIPIEIVHKSIYQLFSRKSMGQVVRDLEESYYTTDHFTEPQDSKIINTNKISIEQLAKDNIDILGKIDFDIADLEFGVTFLAGRPPKSYIKNYLDIANKYNANLIILIEDKLAALKYSRTIKEQKRITNKYRNQLSDYNLIISSNFLPFSVPEYILNILRKLELEDFFQFLEYSRRNLKYATLFDLLHFLWTLTVYTQFSPVYWLSSKNSIVHFQKIAKLTKVKRNMLFLPPEKHSEIKYGVNMKK